MTKYKKSIFIFRRDLRLDDNIGFLRSISQSKQILPIFIFDPRQVEKNPYKGEYLIQFMLESLEDLEKQIEKKQGQLYYLYDQAHSAIEKILKETTIDAIFCNRDYTPFSKKRDNAIQKICKKNNVDFHLCSDYLLNEPEQIKNLQGDPYKVYTAFMKRARSIPVKYPQLCPKKISFLDWKNSITRKEISKKISGEKNKYIQGGRNNAIKKLKKIKQYKNYNEERNFPAQQATTGLSPHNKFGTISIREFFHSVAAALGENHTLINELYWRDFFTHISHHFSYVFGGSFHKKYDNIKWKKSKENFKKWCNGKTGYPIVDAGMRELNETGIMHNRVRMITACFLTKHLQLNWRWGEKYFAQKLVDYDPAVNNGNWQWAASTGCDAQPYFRVFNPWLQQKKFDKETKYIQKWVPELQKNTPKEIHNWHKEQTHQNYPAPIVDHATESKKAKAMFKNL